MPQQGRRPCSLVLLLMELARTMTLDSRWGSVSGQGESALAPAFGSCPRRGSRPGWMSLAEPLADIGGLGRPGLGPGLPQKREAGPRFSEPRVWRPKSSREVCRRGLRRLAALHPKRTSKQTGHRAVCCTPSATSPDTRRMATFAPVTPDKSSSASRRHR